MEWLRFQEAEYQFFEHQSTWVQAQRICTWFQAELASVHSQAELDFLGHNLQKVGTRVSREGRPRSQGKALPPLTCLSRFPSSLGARSSTGGSAYTPQRTMAASGGSSSGQQVWEGRSRGWLVSTRAGDGVAA